MGSVYKYKGYSTKIEFSSEDKVLHGKIEGIQDLVTFESESAGEIESAFQEAVDDYLAFCEKIGKAPDKEYSGSFNIRIRPDTHRMLSMRALDDGVSINHLVERAINHYLSDPWRQSIAEEISAGFQRGLALSPELCGGLVAAETYDVGRHRH